MNGWMIALIVIYTLELGGNMVMHGQRKTGTYNFWSTLIVAGIILWVAYKGMVAGF